MSQWKGYMCFAGITCTPLPPSFSLCSRPSAMQPGPVMCSAMGTILSVMFLHHGDADYGKPKPSCQDLCSVQQERKGWLQCLSLHLEHGQARRHLDASLPAADCITCMPL